MLDSKMSPQDLEHARKSLSVLIDKMQMASLEMQHIHASSRDQYGTLQYLLGCAAERLSQTNPSPPDDSPFSDRLSTPEFVNSVEASFERLAREAAEWRQQNAQKIPALVEAYTGGQS